MHYKNYNDFVDLSIDKSILLVRYLMQLGSIMIPVIYELTFLHGSGKCGGG